MMLTKTNKLCDIGLFDRIKNDSRDISVMSDQYYLVTTCLAAYHFFNIIYYLIEICGLVLTLS